MHAIQIDPYGGPEQMHWVELPDPSPGEGELIVRTAAAGVNFIDTYQREGRYPVELPYVLGLEGAGTVEAVGGGVDRFAVGDTVAWPGTAGSYATLVAVPAARAVAVPAGMAVDDAAAAMLQGMTAHYLSHDTYPLGEASTCLIHAGAGGVGLLLIQMAKAQGATVFTTVSTVEKAALAEEAGADHVIRYTETDFANAVRAIAGTDRPLDVVYDSVGATTFDRGLELLRPRGMMVLFGASSGPVAPFDPLVLNAQGSLFLTRPSLFHHIATTPELDRRAGEVLGAVADGSLRLRVEHRWPLEEAAEAHRALEGRRTTGKVLLVPSL